jgi:hypothetical protein
MGGGHSDPSSVQNDGITLKGNYSGNAHTTYKNLSTGGATNNQSASSKGSTTKVSASYTGPIPVGLQQLNIWDTLKHDAEKAGEGLVHGAEWCYSNPTCKANAEKYGLEAAKAI